MDPAESNATQRNGRLLVAVESASNLLDAEKTNGKSEPYVKISVPSGKQEPHTQKTRC